MKKRIIVLGFPRTGTHLVKEFFYKNLNYKSNPKFARGAALIEQAHAMATR